MNTLSLFSLNAEGMMVYSIDNMKTWIMYDPADSEEERRFYCEDEEEHEEVFDTFEEALGWCETPMDDEDEDEE